MRDHDLQGEVVIPRCLDERSGFEWRQLSAQVLGQRRTGVCSGTNVTLEAAIEREPQSPLAGAYRLWIADNIARDGLWRESLGLYDSAVETLAANPPLAVTIDGVAAALRRKAQCASRAGDTAAAIETYQALARHDSADPGPLFQAGLLMEEAGERDRAAEFYRSVAGKDASDACDDPAELARRNLERLSIPDSAFLLTPDHVVDAIEAATLARDAGRLRSLASSTHFAIGPACSHPSFETAELLDRLCEDFSQSDVRVDRKLAGIGAKRYLRTSGWRGRWFHDDVVLVITRSPRGWQWSGCAIVTPDEHWVEHWRPDELQTNQPLPFELLAPWPAGLCCEAGGLSRYIAEQATVLAALAIPWPFGPAIAAGLTIALSARQCGFGLRGLYYNTRNHSGVHAFAIDFSRYQRFVPNINRSEGTPVLAARGGTVSRVEEDAESGSETYTNLVEIHHGDPNVAGDDDRFTSRYVHLQGPKRVLVSEMMAVSAGNRIGFMDDTGRSFISHLHFSIHDRELPLPNFPMGRSVRPSPMNGVTLEDGDSGKCVCSTNVETFGEKPMIIPSGFAGQNSVIVPVATAAGQTPPANIRQQRWQLVLSGVVLIDMKGVTSTQWRRETLLIAPDLKGPIKFAAQRFGVPLPPGLDDSAFYANFQVEQWAPFSTLSSVFNANQSINSGFAVDAWRPNPFFSATDLATNTPVSNLFAGIQADIAVCDSDAYLYRVGYHITLIGRIVFSPVIIL